MRAFNLADTFEIVADAVPDRTALVCGDARLTYAELDRRANRFAHALRDAGVEPGDHVALYLYNCTEYVEAMLGALKIRAVPINVNYRYVEGELRYLLDDSDAAVVVFHRELAPRVAGVAGSLSKVKRYVVVEDGSGADLGDLDALAFGDAVATASEERDFGERSGNDLYLIYTGGTTGMPKGVMWRHEDLFFTALGGGNPLRDPAKVPEDCAEIAGARDPQLVQYTPAPLIHGAAQLATFIGFHWGDKVVLLPRFDPEDVWETAARERCNTVTIVGDAMGRPMADALERNPGRWDLSSVVYLGSAGALLSPSIKDSLKAALPNAFVTENFGATETGHQGMEAFEDSRPKGGGLRFQMNERTTVLDDDLKPVEPGSGTVGRLALSGRIPLGYYKDETKTAATFVEAGGKRWVMPGDFATVDADGSIIVFGRGAVCINTGGEKVFPEEVEAAIKAHPSVFDAVVVGVPDERWGERVAAVIALRPGASLTMDELGEHCRTHVAGYKVPRELHLVDEIARQPSGKPDYPWAKQVAAKGSV